MSDAAVAKTNDKSARDYYFDSYAHYGIHEEMLKDEVRTKSYRDAIMLNSHLFKDKVVLDVGCGTGILCMFASRAGAKRVIGVDMSDIIDHAKIVVRDNGFTEDQILLLKGKMEEVELPVQHVDIIISEWMGYCLLYESMLNTVLVARDKYLAPGGLIFPDKATMHIAGIEDAQYKQEKIGFWDNVYGFNMRHFQGVVLREPLVDTVEGSALVTNDCIFRSIDIATVQISDLAFHVPFEITALRNDYIHAMIVWFDIDFSAGTKPVSFSTGPAAYYTHWKQTVFYLHDHLAVNQGETITGDFTLGPNKDNARDLDLTLHFKFEGKDMQLEKTHQYRMA
ncbi:hypothetical protein CXG81DRAFT_9949 [Caulochytrium protostelioides]|uniref:type I protein arginine methyltransferase n=2 Tax=Caulochytrium protostelioides TaxID=1555241 RepID=A0A4P9XD45_9FUNG|nr:hypothetical protein CXG81DRAFT_9949 [Caulochytrium protostelioides]|eukprot:RKP03110.1 hypothetical protein CXG81DRAFT_9949 [Caulochytrium protostelioides]